MINNNNYLEAQMLAAAQPDFMKRLMQIQLEANGISQVEIRKVIAKHYVVSSANVVGVAAKDFFDLQQPFPTDEHFLVFGIRVFSGTAAALGSTVWAPGTTDPQILNGTFELNVNGTLFLKSFPFTAAVGATGNADLNAGYIPLDRPILIPATTSFKITSNFPTVVAAANTNLRFHLEGIKLI